uniref:Reverse transcriptase Ty1/copia-type domain-containing protein n=1 Tax=Cajanus cajan TaxID=3821 RepID=A0A151TCY7_CAJCA|nr:hypothetical protein KK1_019532 [Cajanus cajan]
MMSKLEMSNLGLISYFLGIEFKLTQYGIVIHQSKYAKNLLNRSICSNNLTGTLVEVGLALEKDTNEKLVDSTHYRKIVGCLKYFCNIRSDLSINVRLINKFK